MAFWGDHSQVQNIRRVGAGHAMLGGMPVSTPIHLPYCLSLIVGLQPRSVLDIGCGFGTWGFLCRTHLDVFPGRVQPETWTTRIDGIELFAPYIQAHQRALYNEIRVEDVRDAVDHIDAYDLIIAGDVIEHLDRDDADLVLDKLYAKAGRALLVNIPIGAEGWDHPEMHGNPGELHRSAWEPEDFVAYPHMYQAFTLPNGAYGVFWCPKPAQGQARLDGLLVAAQRAVEVGRPLRALALARQAFALAPQDPLAAVLLADLALQLGHAEEAIEALTRAARGTTEDHHRAGLMLAQLQWRLGRQDAAREALGNLLSQVDLSPTVRAEAQALQDTLG